MRYHFRKLFVCPDLVVNERSYRILQLIPATPCIFTGEDDWWILSFVRLSQLFCLHINLLRVSFCHILPDNKWKQHSGSWLVKCGSQSCVSLAEIPSPLLCPKVYIDIVLLSRKRSLIISVIAYFMLHDYPWSPCKAVNIEFRL